MARRRSAPRAAGLWILLLALGPAARAQVAANRATAYLYPTDVTDARALWVNPAGLGSVSEASLHADVTAGDPGPGGRLRQITLGFNSRGFSFGYQRDVFNAGVRGHTYRLGLAAGHAGLAAGVAYSLYRGGTSASGWDVGVVYAAAPPLTLGAVVQQLGEPTVRGTTLPVTYVPGATLRLGRGRLAVSAEGRLPAGGVASYALGLGIGLREAPHAPVRALARVDAERGFRHKGFAFGISVGAQDLVGSVATTPGDLGGVDALSLYGVSSRRPGR